MYGRLAGAVLVTAVTVAGAVVATPAANAASHASYLVMTVTVSGARTDRATLRCYPPSGTHPKASQACVEVAAAKGNLQMLKRRNGVMCTMQYQPATAVAKGSWRGHSVRYQKTFSNSCVLGVETGAVFQF
jgi:hypothetical protein